MTRTLYECLQIDKGSSVGHIVWQGLVGFIIEIFKNHKHDQFAARIPIEGSREKIEVDKWETFGSLLRNGFTEALTPKFEDSVKYKDAVGELPSSSLAVKKKSRRVWKYRLVLGRRSNCERATSQPGTTAVADLDLRTVRLAVSTSEKFGMKKHINFCFSVLVVLLTLASASAFAEEASLDAAPVEKEWTMMVYLNGNNSLDEFGAVNINEMEEIGSDARLNMVVQWASMAASSTKRLYIKKDNDTKRVTSPVVENLAEVDMGKKQSLVDFISWTAKHYPAKHYFVVVWNHGGGWHFVNPNRAAGDLHVTDISWDEKSGHHITTEELGEAMKDAAKIFGHKVDIYGSDACLMAMAEVAYEMNGSVETFVGSEEVEPGTGWPYSKFIADWNKNPKASTLEIGKMLATRYGELYNTDSDQATFSVFDMSKLPAFVTSMKNLATALRSFPDQAGLSAQTRLAIRFTDDDYVDVGNVVGRIKTIASDSATLKAIAAVQAQIKSLVYFNTANTKATGVSVWWPTETSVWSTFQVRYSNLAFNRKSNWYDFLKTFF